MLFVIFKQTYFIGQDLQTASCPYHTHRQTYNLNWWNPGGKCHSILLILSFKTGWSPVTSFNKMFVEAERSRGHPSPLCTVIPIVFSLLWLSSLPPSLCSADLFAKIICLQWESVFQGHLFLAPSLEALSHVWDIYLFTFLLWHYIWKSSK